MSKMGLHDPFGVLKTQVMAKRKVGSQIVKRRVGNQIVNLVFGC
jgi:hypothetical protein